METLASILSPRAIAYIEPLILLASCLTYLPSTLLHHPTLAFTSPPAFRSEWFGAFWKVWGPAMAASPDQQPYLAELFGRARGVVLELGPGGGDQMRHYARVVAEGRVERVYAAEPNGVLHERLVGRAREVGLDSEEERLVVMKAGAEAESLLPALKTVGLLGRDETSLPRQGVFDTVICIKSMCSAPQREMGDTLATIQALLKPGGEFLFFEHVDNGQDRLTMGVARLISLVWPAVMGGCNLDGKIDVVAKRMDGWSSVNIKNTDQFKGYNIFRYVVGVCKKA